MLVSMTGFATITCTITNSDNTKVYLTMNLKSLNARYFEVNSKLPFALQHLETECIKIFKQQLYRGHITFSLQLGDQNFFAGPVQPSLKTVDSYLQAIDAIQKKFSVADKLSINHLIMLPNIFTVQEKTLDKETTDYILQNVQQLTAQLVSLRQQEGATLEKDILIRSSIMQQKITEVEQVAEKLIKKRQHDINQQLAELENMPADLASLKRTQLYMELDKMDIHEEIVRFKSHMNNLLSTIKSPEVEKGRKLDFILQELSREINTIAAKCSDSNISSLAIDIKVELEKIREQMQNIV